MKLETILAMMYFARVPFYGLLAVFLLMVAIRVGIRNKSELLRARILRCCLENDGAEIPRPK